MSKWPAGWRAILFLVLSVLWSGCIPIADTPIDEEKDPNFIEGRNHQNAMDYKGAIEAFERAVQANPRNAAAHFELGLLYDQKMQDHVSAIYHYQKHLELRPKSEYAEAIKPRVTACKMELAKTVTFGVVTREVHRDLEKMTNEVMLLKRQNDALRAQLAAKPMVVTQWMTLRVTNVVNVPQYITNTAPRPAPTNAVRMPAPQTNSVPQRAVAQPQVQPRPQPQAQTQPQARVHRVQSGDTMAKIARRYDISVERLQAANPSVRPNQIRVGQTLNIPAR